MTDPDRENTGQLAPHATRLNLLENGWTPIPLFGKGQRIDKNGKVWPEVPKGWPDAEITEEWLAKAKRKWTNTAIRTGRILAVDIDVTAPHLAVLAEQMVLNTLGDTPFKRVGKAPKSLLLYWLEEPQRKKRTKKFEGHMVEFLSDRSYFVAYGKHPDGMQYEWTTDYEPLDHHIEVLPSVTPQQIEQCIDSLNAMFAAAGLAEDQGQAAGSNGEEYDLTDDMRFQIVDPFDDLLTWGELKDAVPQHATWFTHLTALRPESDSGAGLISWGGSGLHLHDLVTGVTHYSQDTSFKDLGDAFNRQYGEGWHERQMTIPERMRQIRAQLSVTKSILPDRRMTSGKEPKLASEQPTTPHNVATVMSVAGVTVRQNLMTRDMDMNFENPACQALVGVDDFLVRTVMWSICMGDLGMKNDREFRSTLEDLGVMNRYHPFEDWLDTQTWDGRSRLNDICASVEIAPEYRDIWPIYVRRWLLQGVAAARQWRDEDVKQKSSVLVLCGEQGTLKTTWIGALVPPQFRRVGLNLSFDRGQAKDVIMAATGALIVELGELETTFGKSSAGSLKAFLSNPEDVYRVPWGTRDLAWPRATSYAGTVNEKAFLIDDTGSRRFWPVEIDRCNPEHGIDLGQLWAEMDVLFKQGEQWHLTSDEEQMRIDQSDQFEQPSEVRDLFDDWQVARPDLPKTEWVPVTVTDMARHCLDVSASPLMLKQISGLMTAAYGRTRKVLGKRNVWMVPLRGGEQGGIYVPKRALSKT